MPRPPFVTLEGGEIFFQDKWWLTDLSREKEQDKGDEDGPPSDSDGPAEPQADISDEDLISDAETAVSRAPVVAWR